MLFQNHQIREKFRAQSLAPIPQSASSVIGAMLKIAAVEMATLL
jgi:hypothetical protein